MFTFIFSIACAEPLFVSDYGFEVYSTSEAIQKRVTKDDFDTAIAIFLDVWEKGAHTAQVEQNSHRLKKFFQRRQFRVFLYDQILQCDQTAVSQGINECWGFYHNGTSIIELYWPLDRRCPWNNALTHELTHLLLDLFTVQPETADSCGSHNCYPYFFDYCERRFLEYSPAWRTCADAIIGDQALTRIMHDLCPL